MGCIKSAKVKAKMKTLPDEVIQFFHKQNFTVVSTVGSDGLPHNACKAIVKINKSGRVYLLDLYKRETFKNLTSNPHIAVTGVDEHRFKGFSLKGKAKIVKGDKISSQIIRAWEKRLNNRITQRVLKNIGGEKGHAEHPEARFPKPEYMIVMEVQEIVDLTPQHLR